MSLKYENFVTRLKLFDTEAKEIPCIVDEGAPTTSTVGDIGCFYMNSLTGAVYKCIAVNIVEPEENSTFAWIPLNNDDDNGIVGTWVFNDVLTLPNSRIQYNIDFVLSGRICNGIYSDSNFLAYRLPSDSWDVYHAESGWEHESYKTIVIFTDPADDTFKSWLKVNATKKVNNGLPSCTIEDNGKFLVVIDGVASWIELPCAEDIVISIAEEITFNE